MGRQQHPPCPQVVAQVLQRRGAGRGGEADRRGDHIGDQLRCGDRGEVDEPHPVGELRCRGARDLDRNPGLPASCGADNGDQPVGGDERTELAPVPVSAEQRGQRARQVHLDRRSSGRSDPLVDQQGGVPVQDLALQPL